MTKNVTRYAFTERKIFDAGIDVKIAERFSRTKIVPYRVATTDRPGNPVLEKGEIRVFKPAVTRKLTAPPKAFPGANDKYTLDDFRKKHADEKKQLDEYYTKQANELRKAREAEQLKKTPPPDLQKRYEGETKNFNELKNRNQRAPGKQAEPRIERRAQEKAGEVIAAGHFAAAIPRFFIPIQVSGQAGKGNCLRLNASLRKTMKTMGKLGNYG